VKRPVLLDFIISEIIVGNPQMDTPKLVEEIYAQVMDLMNLGLETTLNSLVFTFNLLGRYCEVQDKMAVKVLLEAGKTTPDVELIEETKYLTMIVKESLRMYPVSYIGKRKLDTDIKLGKFDIPKGTQVVYSVLGLHNDDRYFRHPEKFDPDRFKPHDHSKRIYPGTYLPFGSGIRQCMGNTFAMLILKFTIAMLVQHFKFDASEFGMLKYDEFFILKPHGPPESNIKISCRVNQHHVQRVLSDHSIKQGLSIPGKVKRGDRSLSF